VAVLPDALLAKLRTSVFNKFGVPGIIRRVTSYGTLNILTGSMDGVIIQDYPIKYVEDKKTIGFVAKNLVETTAQSVLVLGDEVVAPNTLDKFIRGGVASTIKSIHPVSYEGTVIVYQVELT
jgi:hypothetical protein